MLDCIAKEETLLAPYFLTNTLNGKPLLLTGLYYLWHMLIRISPAERRPISSTRHFYVGRSLIVDC